VFKNKQATKKKQIDLIIKLNLALVAKIDEIDPEK
jgi:hypothetical protein